VTEIQSAEAKIFFELVQDAEQAQHQLKDIHEEVDRRALQDAEVIGLTTSGLARHVSTLHHVRCKALVCEEAGEVMEPHLLSALLASIEHFIQIGDHEQLRPTINNFGLSLESTQGLQHQLDRSQFERFSVGQLKRPRMPVAQLDVQRRMRPEISAFHAELSMSGYPITLSRTLSQMSSACARMYSGLTIKIWKTALITSIRTTNPNPTHGRSRWYMH
jgi:hypothetical protein